MERKLLLIAGSVISLLGCAVAPTHFVDVDWAKTKPTTKLKVYVQMGKVENPDDLADDLPKYAANFMDYFTPRFTNSLDAALPVPLDVVVLSKDSFKSEQVLITDIDTLKVKIPKTCDASDGVVLVVGPWHFERSLEFQKRCPIGEMGCVEGPVVKYRPDGMPSTYKEIKGLRMAGAYSYYDCKSSTYMGYGRIQSDDTFNFYMDSTNWEKVIDQLPEILLKDTPYFVADSERQ